MGRQLAILTVVTAVLLVGCGQDPTTSAEYTQLEEELAAAEAALVDVEGRTAGLTAEVRTVQEEWVVAWNAEDVDAVRSMMVFGGRHYCPATGTNGVGGADLVAFVEEGWRMADVEIVSATRTQTPGDPAVVSDDYVVVTEFTRNGHPGYLSVLHLRGPDGSLRVLDHHAYPPPPRS